MDLPQLAAMAACAKEGAPATAVSLNSRRDWPENGLQSPIRCHGGPEMNRPSAIATACRAVLPSRNATALVKLLAAAAAPIFKQAAHLGDKGFGIDGKFESRRD